MIKFAINKLIRDKIPSLIGEWQYRVLADAEFKDALFNKLEEEAAELKSATQAENITQELADVLEVLRSIADVHHIDWQDVLAAQENKKAQKGGFNQRVFGTVVAYDPEHPIVEKMRGEGRYQELSVG